jgi:drug/metabolite transporter (DMT)-like permease
MLGCALVPCVVIGLLMSLAAVATALATVAGRAGPFSRQAGMGLFSAVLCGLIGAFFITVSRRLVSTMRGQQVPHLFPPVVGVIVGGIMGLIFVVFGFLSLFTDFVPPRAVGGISIGAGFLAYAWRMLRQLRPAPPPTPR